MGSSPGGVCLTPRALGHLLGNSRGQASRPCCRSVSPTNITFRIWALGCLYCTTHFPRVGVGEQLGGEAGRDHQNPILHCQAVLPLIAGNSVQARWGSDSRMEPPVQAWPPREHPAALSAPAQATPHFPDAVVSEGSSFPSSSTENMTSLPLPRGGSVSCSG